MTPTCHLLVEGDHQRARTIALFPPETVSVADTTPLDLPLRAPALLHRGEELAAYQRHPVTQMARRIKRKVVPSRY